MKLPEVNIELLLEAGIHFGHNTRRWNPKMEKYIFGSRNNIHIIDLRLTIPLLNNALIKLFNTVEKSGKVLLVGTKKQASSVVQQISQEAGQFYINKRWLGGTLTNWKTISNSITKLNDLEKILTDQNSLKKLSKKELLNLTREKDKLILNIGGIRDLNGRPDLLLVFDVVKDNIAVLEANKLNIPVIGIIDTNADPDKVDFPIPGNDDAIRSINLYADIFLQTMIEARKMIKNIEIPEETKIVKDLNKIDPKNKKDKIIKKKIFKKKFTEMKNDSSINK